MIPRDVFVVGVRVVGLLQLAKALDYLLQAFDMVTGLFKAYSTTLGGCYSHIIVYLGVGIYLLSGAPHLVHKIYGSWPGIGSSEADTSHDKREQV